MKLRQVQGCTGQRYRRNISTMKSPYHSRRDSRVGAVGDISWIAFPPLLTGGLKQHQVFRFRSTVRRSLALYTRYLFQRLWPYHVECWLEMAHWKDVKWFLCQNPVSTWLILHGQWSLQSGCFPYAQKYRR